MTAIEAKMSLLQEMSVIMDDEKLIDKALVSLRRLKARAGKTKKVDEVNEDHEDHELTKEEILAGIKEGLQAIKDRREGKDVTGVFMDAREWLNEI